VLGECCRGIFQLGQTVYTYFQGWRDQGIWEGINRDLRQWVRLRQNRPSSPSPAIIETQSVKTGSLTKIASGFDGGKKVKGRKRHILVDTWGGVVMVVVTAAHVSDPAGAGQLFKKLQPQRRRLQRLVLIWADGAYRGQDFLKWVFDTYRWIIEVVLRQDQQPEIRVVPKRWVVERTLGWLHSLSTFEQRL